jgi:hypothetical protein
MLRFLMNLALMLTFVYTNVSAQDVANDSTKSHSSEEFIFSGFEPSITDFKSHHERLKSIANIHRKYLEDKLFLQLAIAVNELNSMLVIHSVNINNDGYQYKTFIVKLIEKEHVVELSLLDGTFSNCSLFEANDFRKIFKFNNSMGPYYSHKTPPVEHHQIIIDKINGKYVKSIYLDLRESYYPKLNITNNSNELNKFLVEVNDVSVWENLDCIFENIESHYLVKFNK